jgi:exosortase A-associated hydrolase 1
MADHVLTLDCMGEGIVALLSEPEDTPHTGIIVIPGGPQYRAGSHRQFLLMARGLAREGVAVLRFDPRGRGDSMGAIRGFEDLTADIGSAIDAFRRACPSLQHVVLWGLCDAASAALLYCREAVDARVSGIVLVNPWMHSDETQARTHLKHYYARRLVQPHFWVSLFTGRTRYAAALSSFLLALRKARGGVSTSGRRGSGFQARMAETLKTYTRPVLIVLSGNDLTAKEFVEYWGPATGWPALLQRPNIECVHLPEANHTFSTSAARTEVEAVTLAWLKRSFKNAL